MSGILQLLLGNRPAATAWAWQSTGAIGTGTNPVAALPATHGAGSLLVIAATSGGAITAPAGWSISVNMGVAPELALFYKMDSGSESSVTLTSASTAAQAAMISYSGINSGAPLDVNGTNNGTLTTTSLTTTVAGDLIVSAYSSKNNAATWTGTPAGTNVRVNATGTGLQPLLVVDELQAAAGATSTRTATESASTNPASMAVSFKL